MHNHHNPIMAEDELPLLDESPLLLGFHENKDEQIVFTLTNNNSSVKKIAELQGKTIITSDMGWLILQDRENSKLYSLWNPITRNSILLPELLDPPPDEEQVICVFTSPPYYKDSKCVLLLFCEGIVFTCNPTMADCNWVKQSLELEGKIVDISEAVTLNGDIYAYADLITDKSDNEEDNKSSETVFIRLKVDSSDNPVNFEKLSLKCSSRMYQYKMLCRGISYLGEVCGELYSVNVISRQLELEKHRGYDIFKVFVWKLDLSKMEWVQVESLRDRALLVGDSTGCGWCWADTFRGGRIEENCVYMVNDGSDIIHQCRLQDSSYSVLSSHIDFQGASDGPIWFIPYQPTRLTSVEKTLLEKIPDTHLVENSENSKYVEELEGPTPLLLDLPSHVVTSIADRLHWFDCMSLRASCKKMRSEIPKPKWKANSSLPLFMFLKNSEGICELWDPCYPNNGSITKKLPYSPSVISTIEFCKDGWVLLRSHEGCYLEYLNLFTGEKGEYPDESIALGLSNFALSSSPNSPDCVTAGIGSMGCVDISILGAGDVKWKTFQIHMQNGIYFRPNYNASPKYHCGSFYFLDENRNLAVLKPIDRGFEWSIHEGPPQEEESRKASECYIAELDGQLVYVFIQDLGSKLRVYKLDESEELWAEVVCLGDFVLFLSSAQSVSIAVKDRSMSNRIYVPKRIGNEMVFYSLDTGKYHTSSSKESYENFQGMISQSFSCWV